MQMEEKSNQTIFEDAKNSLLSLKYTKDGMFQGYITHLKDIKHIFVTANYEHVLKMNAMASTEIEKSLKSIKTGTLAIVRLIHTFARVKILATISKTKSQVLLIDTGHEIMVENSNLYEISKNLSVMPPLAIAVKVNYSEIYPEALNKDLQHLVGANILFELDEITNNNITLIKNVSIFNTYLNSNISYYASIVHNELFNSNHSVLHDIPAAVTFVQNSVVSRTLPSNQKHVAAAQSSYLVALLVFIMIFGSIGFVVAKFFNDKRKVEKCATTITIGAKTAQQCNDVADYSTNGSKPPLSERSSRTHTNFGLERKPHDIESLGQIADNNSKNSGTYQLCQLNGQQQSNEDDRLQAGMSMLSSIYQQSGDYGHYYSSSANTTFSYPREHTSRKTNANTFPKQSTPINSTVNSSAEDDTQCRKMDRSVDTMDIFRNVTMDVNKLPKRNGVYSSDDSFYSSASRKSF